MGKTYDLVVIGTGTVASVAASRSSASTGSGGTRDAAAEITHHHIAHLPAGSVVALTQPLATEEPGLAPAPPMGWNSWNHFGCDVTEGLIRETADAMVESGMREAGYAYVNIDDCWHGQRDSLGFIQADPDRFPSGIAALAATPVLVSGCYRRGVVSKTN